MSDCNKNNTLSECINYNTNIHHNKEQCKWVPNTTDSPTDGNCYEKSCNELHPDVCNTNPSCLTISNDNNEQECIFKPSKLSADADISKETYYKTITDTKSKIKKFILNPTILNNDKNNCNYNTKDGTRNSDLSYTKYVADECRDQCDSYNKGSINLSGDDCNRTEDCEWIKNKDNPDGKCYYKKNLSDDTTEYSKLHDYNKYAICQPTYNIKKKNTNFKINNDPSDLLNECIYQTDPAKYKGKGFLFINSSSENVSKLKDTGIIYKPEITKKKDNDHHHDTKPKLTKSQIVILSGFFVSVFFIIGIAFNEKVFSNGGRVEAGGGFKTIMIGGGIFLDAMGGERTDKKRRLKFILIFFTVLSLIGLVFMRIYKNDYTKAWIVFASIYCLPVLFTIFAGLKGHKGGFLDSITGGLGDVYDGLGLALTRLRDEISEIYRGSGSASGASDSGTGSDPLEYVNPVYEQPDAGSLAVAEPVAVDADPVYEEPDAGSLAVAEPVAVDADPVYEEPDAGLLAVAEPVAAAEQAAAREAAAQAAVEQAAAEQAAAARAAEAAAQAAAAQAAAAQERARLEGLVSDDGDRYKAERKAERRKAEAAEAAAAQAAEVAAAQAAEQAAAEQAAAAQAAAAVEAAEQAAAAIEAEAREAAAQEAAQAALRPPPAAAATRPPAPDLESNEELFEMYKRRFLNDLLSKEKEEISKGVSSEFNHGGGAQYSFFNDMKVNNYMGFLNTISETHTKKKDKFNDLLRMIVKEEEKSFKTLRERQSRLWYKELNEFQGVNIDGPKRTILAWGSQKPAETAFGQRQPPPRIPREEKVLRLWEQQYDNSCPIHSKNNLLKNVIYNDNFDFLKSACPFSVVDILTKFDRSGNDSLNLNTKNKFILDYLKPDEEGEYYVIIKNTRERSIHKTEPGLKTGETLVKYGKFNLKKIQGEDLPDLSKLTFEILYDLLSLKGQVNLHLKVFSIDVVKDILSLLEEENRILINVKTGSQIEIPQVISEEFSEFIQQIANDTLNFKTRLLTVFKILTDETLLGFIERVPGHYVAWIKRENHFYRIESKRSRKRGSDDKSQITLRVPIFHVINSILLHSGYNGNLPLFLFKTMNNEKALMINDNLIFDFDEEPFYKKYSEMNFTRYQNKLRKIDGERTEALPASGAIGAQAGASEEDALAWATQESLRLQKELGGAAPIGAASGADQPGPGGAAPRGAAPGPSGGGKKKKRKISFKKRKNKRNKTEKR